MGWNGIGMGWPNASAYSGPVPTDERYLLTSCTGVTGACVTPDFPIGTYVVNDRLRYEFEGYSQFGLVSDITTAPEDNVIDIYPTGVNTTQCIDNYLNLFPELIAPLGQQQIIFKYSITPLTTSFVSTEEEYEFGWAYYYEVYFEWDDDGETNDQYFTFTDGGTIYNYNINAGDSFQLDIQYEMADGPILAINIDEGFSFNPNFPAISSFTVNECSYPYFMRTFGTQNGSTFFINYTSDC